MKHRCSRFIGHWAAVAAAALLATACESRRPEGEAQAKADAAAPTAAARPKPPAGVEDRSAASDDRFDAKIAEHLPRVPDPAIVFPEGAGAAEELDNATFRDRVVAFVREVSAGGEKVTCTLPLPSARPLQTVVWIYREGAQVGRGEASNEKLCAALKDATRRAVAATGGEREALAGARFVVHLPERRYALVEHQGKGVELVEGLVPARALDKALLARRVEEGKDYLLRVLDPQKKGAHKYYHANTDKFEDELHTIYTASTALTLLELRAHGGGDALLEPIKNAAEFMLSMQAREPRERGHGGFYYSYDTKAGRHDGKLVSGTTSKSIFTLLELFPVTKDKKHMDAALLAADFLLTMQKPDGSVRSYVRQEDGGGWMSGKNESMLYTGQVLSALSRMYRATKNPKYGDAAAQTAGYLASRVSQKGCWLGDDYRKPNPVSSSWVVMSLLDFVKATGDAQMERLVFRCADDLLGKQRRRPDDVYRHGRWMGSLSSSGTGWLAEVMSEVYLHCRDKGMEGCKRFEDAVIAAMRQILQYTYTPESAFVAKNPEAARGGIFWSVRDRYVRTDSVCHGMNAFIHMLPHLGDGPLVSIPERPLAQRLGLAPGAPVADDGDAEDERDEDGADDEASERGAGAKPP